MRTLARSAAFPEELSAHQLLNAWQQADEFLASIPSLFGLEATPFFEILNQRNLSGLVGEVFKHAIHRAVPGLIPNPHPDGRPDLLAVIDRDAKKHFLSECFDADTGAPIRGRLAPFSFGGLELKATIGDLASAAGLKIGMSRAHLVKNINYWAHHQHPCRLLGLYYDFDQELDGVPQVKAIFFAELTVSHWAKVSTGRSHRKKTSNTSLLKAGRELVKAGILAYDDSARYQAMLNSIGVSFT